MEKAMAAMQNSYVLITREREVGTYGCRNPELSSQGRKL